MLMHAGKYSLKMFFKLIDILTSSWYIWNSVHLTQ